MSEILTFIWNDMLSLVTYVPLAFSITCLFGGILLVIKSITKSKWAVHIFIYYMLFIFYLIMVLQIAYFSREPGSRPGVDLILLGTWGDTAKAHSYVIENILLFIPFGILLPCIWQPMRRLRSFIPAPLICSGLLEAMQWITGRGYCQLDDIITNVLGGLLGFLLFQTVYQLKKKSRQ